MTLLPAPTLRAVSSIKGPPAMLRSILVALSAAFALPLPGAAQTHPPIVETPPEPGVVQGCGHYAVIGAARTLGGAFDFQDHLGATGSGVLDNDNVAQFRDGYHSIVFGPYKDRELAQDKVAIWRGRAPDAYVRYGCVEGVNDIPAADGADPAAPLPIPRGVYVLEGVSCDRPPNFAFRVYGRKGLSGSATRDCRFAIEDRARNLFGGSNSCVNTHDGSRTATALSVRVLGPERFRLAENGTIEGDFRFCAGPDPADFGAESFAPLSPSDAFPRYRAPSGGPRHPIRGS